MGGCRVQAQGAGAGCRGRAFGAGSRGRLRALQMEGAGHARQGLLYGCGRALQIESISSKMMMCRSLSSPRSLYSASASAKSSRMFSSLWPTYLLSTSGPLTIFGSLPDSESGVGVGLRVAGWGCGLRVGVGFCGLGLRDAGWDWG